MGELKWREGVFGACSPTGGSCGTVSGQATRTNECWVSYLNSREPEKVNFSLCAGVTSSIGSQPSTVQGCSVTLVACPPPPVVSSSGGGTTPCVELYSPAVCMFYQDVLGREPEPAGGNYWESQLNNGAFGDVNQSSDQLIMAMNGGVKGKRDCSHLGKTDGLCV